MGNHSFQKVLNQVPADYYQKGTKNNYLQKFWHHHKINSAVDILSNLKFQNCLDVGCASGFMLSELAKSFPNVSFFGIDAYHHAIAYAKKTYPQITFKKSLAEKMPFKQNSFELIISYETIEHSEHPKEFLEEVKRILRKDGTFILAMDSGNLLFKIVWGIWEKTYGAVWQNAHIHAFHHDKLEILIKKVGFKIHRKFFTHLGMEVVFILKKT